MQYNVLEARDQLSKLIDAAANGEEVVIAKRGEPIVKLVKVESKHPRGSAAAISEWLDNNPIDPKTARSSEEIEREIREARGKWR